MLAEVNDWGVFSMSFPKKEQTEYLIHISGPSKVASAEKQVRASRTKYLWLLFSVLIGSTAAIILINLYLAVLTEDYPFLYVFLAAFCADMIYGGLNYCIIFRSGPEYNTFRTLVLCTSKVNSAMGSQPASSSRKAVAATLLRGAWHMRGYGPIVALRLHQRIIRREATRASRALRDLAYPVVLGTDKELMQVKEALARAAIRVGTSNWVQVGNLVSGVPPTTKLARLRGGYRTLLQLLVAVVVPLAVALIPALFSSG
jgi:hypothetical protein